MAEFSEAALNPKTHNHLYMSHTDLHFHPTPKPFGNSSKRGTGVAKGHDDWFDELHLKSHVFKKVANAYKECIDGFGSTDKVVRAKP